MKERRNIEFTIVDTYSMIVAEHDAGQWEDNEEISGWRRDLCRGQDYPVTWQVGGWPSALQNQDMVARCGPGSWKLIGQFDLSDVSTHHDGYMRGFFWITEKDARDLNFEAAVLLGEAD